VDLLKRENRKRGVAPPEGPKRAYRTLAYPVEFRLGIVRLFLEEGYSTTVLREQFGVSGHYCGSGWWALNKLTPSTERVGSSTFSSAFS